jgi:hypothetical protein
MTHGVNSAAATPHLPYVATDNNFPFLIATDFHDSSNLISYRFGFGFYFVDNLPWNLESGGYIPNNAHIRVQNASGGNSDVGMNSTRDTTTTLANTAILDAYYNNADGTWQLTPVPERIIKAVVSGKVKLSGKVSIQ